MNKFEFSMSLGAVLVGAIFIMFIIELASINPYSTYCDATIISVVEGEVTTWSDHNMTYVKYTNNISDSHVGRLGKPGDTLRVLRHRGSESLLGIFGDVTCKEAYRLRIASEDK